jgi:hypothetical protein
MVIHTVVGQGPAMRILVNKFHGFDNLAGPADGGDSRRSEREADYAEACARARCFEQQIVCLRT